MKKLASFLMAFSLLIASLAWLSFAKPVYAANFHNVTQNVSHISLHSVHILANRADAKLPDVYGDKIDLNNTNVRAFQQFPGFYPTLARKVIVNAPYEKVEDALEIKGLSKRQRSLLESHLEDFTVTKAEAFFNEGADRFNNGIYR
ncbi:MAG: photosystem II complex extrinsic protein PsbU [Cyanobacteria bacterium P01_A01_bin.45]